MKISFTNDYFKIEDLRLSFFANLAEGVTLDLGCSQLQNPYFKKNNKITKTVGIDMVLPNNNIYDKFIKLDLNGNMLPFEKDAFDCVVAGEILEHLENPEAFLREIKRVLKPKGKLILSMPNMLYFGEIIRRILMLPANEDNEHLYLHDRMSISNLLSRNGFRIKNIYGYKMWIPLLKLHLISFKLPSFLSYHLIFISHNNSKK